MDFKTPFPFAGSGVFIWSASRKVSIGFRPQDARKNKQKSGFNPLESIFAF